MPSPLASFGSPVFLGRGGMLPAGTRDSMDLAVQLGRELLEVGASGAAAVVEAAIAGWPGSGQVSRD